MGGRVDGLDPGGVRVTVEGAETGDELTPGGDDVRQAVLGTTWRSGSVYILYNFIFHSHQFILEDNI